MSVFDEIVSLAQGMYLVEDQTRALLQYLESFVEQQPGESELQAAYRMVTVGFVRIESFTVYVNVQRLAKNLHKSQQWVRDLLTASFYYWKRSGPRKMKILRMKLGCFTPSNENNEWEFYQANVPRWCKESRFTENRT